MKSIRRRYQQTCEKNSYWSSLLCFSEAVRNQGFSKDTIHRWFPKLVDHQDYDHREKLAILEHIVYLSNIAEDDKF